MEILRRICRRVLKNLFPAVKIPAGKMKFKFGIVAETSEPSLPLLKIRYGEEHLHDRGHVAAVAQVGHACTTWSI